MKFILNLFLAFGLAFGAAFLISGGNMDARAQSGTSSNALMTIRFTQKNVPYQDKLFYVVREAVKTKPTVVFDVVGVSKTGQSEYGAQVANDIARIGVSPAQITFRPESGNVSTEEVRIFVR